MRLEDRKGLSFRILLTLVQTPYAYPLIMPNGDVRGRERHLESAAMDSPHSSERLTSKRHETARPSSTDSFATGDLFAPLPTAS
jgi:hypothetical protein